MISCGEPSGDLYAGALAVEIRRRQPDAAIFGLGGQRLMAGGGELLADYRGLSVTGLVEAIRVLPKSLTTLNRLVDAAHTEKPQALVLIDFPDFNFRLAAAVKKLGVPIIYYISPQLWAWRQSRMKVMKRLADRVLVIFPFEEEIYRRAGVPVQFVGHPLVDLARAQEPEGRFPARDRPRTRPPDRGVVARQPPQRGRAIAADLPRCGRAVDRANAAGAVRRRARALARRSAVRASWRGPARAPSKCSPERTTCSRFVTWRSPRPARPPFRPLCTGARWWWCIACLR